MRRAWSTLALATSLAVCVPILTTTPASAADTANPVVINEIESNGGDPGDWVELLNTGTADVDLSGWIVKDNDDSHTASIPDGTVIPPGGHHVVEASMLGYGLGSDDAVRVYTTDGTTLVDSMSWTNHAPVTLGRCPDGTGDFVAMTTSTKGAANDCGTSVRINEIESNGGTPGDWVELTNIGADTADVSGFVVRDNDDEHALVIADGTTIAPGGYLVADVDPAFGLGGADEARLFGADGTTLVDSHGWDGHAAATYGRCPDGTGDFAETAEPTRGAANLCAGETGADQWPGSPDVSPADAAGALGGDISGLAFTEDGSGSAELWAVDNGNGRLFRLTQDGSTWIPADGWDDGSTLRYPGGTGTVDAEGVAFTDAGVDGGVYVASERNNDASGQSRLAVLRYEVAGPGDELIATHEWDLTADLPAVGANAGLEAITWVPDDLLVAQGLLDDSTGSTYDPADHPGHGDGLFLVGVEADGMVHAYALDESGDFTRITSFSSGFPAVMELEYEPESQLLWALCDDTCDGRSSVLEIAQQGQDAGRFAVSRAFERPTGMPNLNNEGFAIAPRSQCVDDAKPVVWADDGNTDDHALRAGTIGCDEPGGAGGPQQPGEATDPVPVPGSSLTDATRGSVDVPPTAHPGDRITVSMPSELAGEAVNVWLHSEPVHLGTFTVRDDGTATVLIPSDTAPGAHRIVVAAATGELIGWDDLRVLAPELSGADGGANSGDSSAGAALPDTGAPIAVPLVAAAVALLLVGSTLVAGRRRELSNAL